MKALGLLFLLLLDVFVLGVGGMILAVCSALPVAYGYGPVWFLLGVPAGIFLMAVAIFLGTKILSKLARVDLNWIP